MNKQTKPYLLYLFFLYLVIKPFYLLPSGLPQIADFIALLIILLYFLKHRIHINISMLFVSLLLVIYTLLINSIWGIFYSDFEFIVSSLFYIYNVLMLIITINLYRLYGNQLLKYVYYGVVSSVSVQFILSFFHNSGSSVREMLFFNNPNQLGYYALLSLTIVLLIDFKLRTNTFYLIIFSSIILYLSLISLSKASIIGNVLLILLYLAVKLITEKDLKTVFIASVVSFSLITFVNVFEEQIKFNPLYESVSNRLNTISLDLKSNMEERRYDRLSEYPQYLIFGAGEGLYHYRFGVGEIHSTFFSFLFSYGVVGLLILSAYIFLILKEMKFVDLLLLVPIFIYGLTHNGIRQSFLWIILALIYIDKIRVYGDEHAKNTFLLRKS